MKRDRTADPRQPRKLVLERKTLRKLEDQDLERVNGGRQDLDSACGPVCTL